MRRGLYALAEGWAQTNVQAVRQDVERLGIEGAVRHHRRAIGELSSAGDKRWDSLLAAEGHAALCYAFAGLAGTSGHSTGNAE